MKISILSDFHFGYGRNTRLERDSFQNAQEAISKSLDSDLILIAGDIFDTRTPRTEMWSDALRVLSRPLLTKNKGVELVRTINKDLDEISKRTLERTPVISLHGTHERRGRDQINAIQALEQTGFLIHLHCNGMIFQKGEQRVAIQGMSGVPERYSKQILDRWDPKPIEGCYNILMLHQSIEPYVYSPLEPPTLNLFNLPEGFDLIIDGHIHTREKTRVNKTTLLLPGSTVVTQLKEEEAEVLKGIYQLELGEGVNVNFIPLENNRKFFYREIELREDLPIRDQIEGTVTGVLEKEFKKIPIIKLKILGKETGIVDKELRGIEKKYSNKAIIRFSKELESPEITRKIELLRNLRERKLSVEEMGLKIMNENLEDLKFAFTFDSERFFKMMSDGEVERGFQILAGEQKTLAQIFKRP